MKNLIGIPHVISFFIGAICPVIVYLVAFPRLPNGPSWESERDIAIKDMSQQVIGALEKGAFDVAEKKALELYNHTKGDSLGEGLLLRSLIEQKKYSDFLGMLKALLDGHSIRRASYKNLLDSFHESVKSGKYALDRNDLDLLQLIIKEEGHEKN